MTGQIAPLASVRHGKLSQLTMTLLPGYICANFLRMTRNVASA